MSIDRQVAPVFATAHACAVFARPATMTPCRGCSRDVHDQVGKRAPRDGWDESRIVRGRGLRLR